MGERSRRIRERTSREPETGSSVAVPLAGGRATWIVLAIALALVLLAYANATRGEFVYDDAKQIVGNPLIQHSQYLGKALSSDVWAFTGESAKNWSNYWRPLFIAWLTLHHALFGLEPTLWHASNIVLHFLATALGYFVLRSLGARWEIAAIATWLFAAHPAHVESITWISGSPDPMVTSCLFGATLFHLAARRAGKAASWVGGPLLFGAGLLAKEIAIVFPAIVFATEVLGTDDDRRSVRDRLRAALRAFAPTVVVAVVYMVVRVAIIGMKYLTPPGSPGLDGVVLSAPEVLAFYLRHALAPLGLGPSYPLRPVTPATLGFENFVLPLAIVAAFAVGAFVLARRRALYRMGLVWFLLPLAPVFDVRSFLPEDFVHDRYLYLPLFGAVLFVATAAADAGDRLLGRARNRTVVAWAFGLPAAILLALVTLSYNRAWMNEVALWESGVRSNPETSFPHLQLGEAYRQAGRPAEARRELERALALNPGLTNAHVALGAVAVRENRLDEAEGHLRQVLAQYPDFGPALEQLALVYQKQGKFDDAIAVFERIRRTIPLRHALYTVNIAVLHRMANRSPQALSELESLGERLETSTEPQVLRAWWYLGELYRESGQRDRAIRDYEKYLAVTANERDPEVVALRKIVADTLARTRAGEAGS